jgi:hypothetical protein
MESPNQSNGWCKNLQWHLLKNSISNWLNLIHSHNKINQVLVSRRQRRRVKNMEMPWLQQLVAPPIFMKQDL